MKVFLAFLLILAVSVSAKLFDDRCTYEQEGRILVRYLLYYWGVCHNGIIYTCGSGPGEPEETRPFCFRRGRPSSPTKY
ncbi:unnamed protein product [Caenorhabditis angaria]|uniref:Uncharacterized protein n=1 Tax=Caenorhabditis angaria TaxID=860376 RepID=A0A9P1N0V5_9PELO|nr:unnamed protein product [Caenorhabditis angaria]